ncbi:MAG: 16S rRNA (guanine(966)-N(2))-methyltransferase RsmD [Alphaproteobacteria bacterium]|nr:16S rRNA (guanine(966)-N(2))-methyltransferase RsmD [Alphaproteobacteria bacterium]
MRIVGGNHRGLALAGPKSQAIRPTSDRTREALFNILAHGVEDFELEGGRVLDLFAGTGALGLEALSRGATYALFIEEASSARALIRQNVEAMGATGVSKIWRRDAMRLGKLQGMTPFDLVFADPPYGKGLGEKALLSAAENGWLNPSALCVLEETAKAEIEIPGGFEMLDKRGYGETQVLFLKRT